MKSRKSDFENKNNEALCPLLAMKEVLQLQQGNVIQFAATAKVLSQHYHEDGTRNVHHPPIDSVRESSVNRRKYQMCHKEGRGKV